MIRSLSISHLGPHVATRLALPVGASEDGKTRPVPCTIRGPSMAGKSTISDAVTMALWGCDTFGSSMSLDALSGERGEVVLTLSSGTRVRRALSRRVTKTEHGDRVTRVVQQYIAPREGDTVAKERSVPSQAKLGQKLGALGNRPALCRVIMLPRAWVPLASGAGGGRALRDLLATILPPADIRGVVADLMLPHILAPSDCYDSMKDAATQRRDATRQATRDEGAAAQASATLERVTAGQPVAVPAADVATAAQVIAAADAWDAYRVDMRAFAARLQAVEDAEAAVKRHALQLEALGAEPEAPPPLAEDDIDWARAVVASTDQWARYDEAATEHRHRAASVDACNARIKAWDTSRAQLGDAPEARADTCAACLQTLPDIALDEWTQAVASLGPRLVEQVTFEPPTEPTIPRPSRDDAARAPAVIASGRTQRAALQTWQAQSAAWRRQRARLGEPPAVPTAGEAPQAPTGAAPGADEVARARSVQIKHQAYTAQAAGYAGVIAGATKARDEAVAQAAASRAEAERMEAMLDAVRRAPSEDLRRRLGDTLGDMGPVSLHVTDTGVDVRFDGREWRRSSRGRQVVCGLILRDALRQASALRWLPLLVDDASAWSGTWPACAGQVVYMVTAPGDGLTVSEGAP